MCGIAGKLSPGASVDPGLIERMCGVLEHRGPDARGTFVEDGVGLGAQRLAVIDPHGGDQPIYNEDRSVVVVLNGEIYNYRELRDVLAARGHRLATTCDTEVIVHLYEDHGDACVDHLRGMFALALWDRRRRRLLLARDRIGVKPLVYAHRNGALWFASEAKAVLEDEAVPREMDPVAIDSFLHYQYVPQPRTAFAALRKLPPAHVLTCEEGRVELRRYWKLSYRPTLAGVGDGELAELIRSRLLEATRLRMRSDVPYGALLSGGVDSGSVVAAMARLGGDRVRTFSIGFDSPDLDERAHARAVAQLYDTEHRELVVGPEAAQVLPRLVWHYGEPFADASAIPTFQLAALARGSVKVALGGDGGDECFAGYHRHTGLDRDGDVLGLYSDRLAHGYFDEPARRAAYTPDFRAEVGDPATRSVIAEPFAASDSPALLGRILDVDVQTYLPDDLLVKMDVASMAHSLEVRSPLLDQAFVETAAAIPAERKLDGATSKRIFKEALRPWLPAATLDRPKMGFSVPLDRWLREELAPLTAEVLLDPHSLARGIFRPRAIRRLVREHRRGSRDHSGRIWALLQLELWLRTFVDRSPAHGPIALAVA